VKLIGQTILISCGLFVGAQMSFAQSVNIYFGVGTAMDSSSNAQIDTFGTGTPYTTPALNGAFLDLGTSILFTKKYGVGAAVSWRAAQGNYAGLQYRPTFYDFDGIWEPMSTKRFEPEIHAGLGGMHIGYSFNQTQCDQFAGCSSFNQTVETSSHFQVHGAAAVRIYLNDHVFVRPAIDVHYVNNLFQFGSNFVPEYSVGIGYSFARD
jgi:hypothetical protein